MGGRYIGVDVGGTKVAVAALEDGAIEEHDRQPTRLDTPDALVDQLATMIAAAGTADAVGIGVPSLVDFATGTARHSVNIPLAGVPLRHQLSERLGVPVYVDNDATVAALAEATGDDGAPAVQHLVMFTVGTGVGGGIVIGGRVFRGATGAAGELGHQLVAADLRHGAPQPEGFPQPASLEALASGRALDALGREHGLPDHSVVDLAQGGDDRALLAIRVLGERLGVGIANAINVFDPDVVAIGGGISAAGDLLLEPARAAAQRFVVPGAGTHTTIRLSRYGPAAGMRGACLLAAHELEEEQRR
jgi:glucokinase